MSLEEKKEYRKGVDTSTRRWEDEKGWKQNRDRDQKKKQGYGEREKERQSKRMNNCIDSRGG